MRGGQRAVWRWAVRLFRREWRQQVLVIALLTVAVAAAIGGASAAYALGSLDNEARFGLANQLYRFDGSNEAANAANVGALRAHFGTIDVIARRDVAIPGTSEIVELRAQDPEGPYGRVMLALQAGRHPAGAAEVAVTDRVATLFDLGVGDAFVLEGQQRTVVGLVENPKDLRDDFALLAPEAGAGATTVSVLVLSPEAFHDHPAAAESTYAHEMVDVEPSDLQRQVATVAMGAAAVAMVLVTLVASAGFVVLAQRRQRQLGMLAAIGAGRRHLRLVLVANGALVGAVAALLGTATGLLGWAALSPALETTVQARIDRTELLPWWLIAIGMLLAVCSATAAAWWPARAVARLPVALALSGRPAPPRPVRRSALLACGLIAAGVAGLVAAGRANQPLVALGTIAIVIGTLALSPLAVRLLGELATHLPVAPRVALRDLARHQNRSSAALAAISLAMGIAATIVVATSAIEQGRDLGNLSDSQLLATEEGKRIREVVTVRTPEEVARLRGRLTDLIAPLGDPVVVPLEMAVNPAESPNPGRGGMVNAFVSAAQIGDGPQTADPGPLFVATPEVLALYGLTPGELDAGTEVLTVRPGDVGLRLGIGEETIAGVQRLDTPAYREAPTSLITQEAVARRGWVPAFAGWLVDTGRPLTSSQIARVLGNAGNAGLQVVVRDGVNVADLRTLRTGGIAVGGVVALAVLTLTVGLIRSQADADLRTLAATGATSAIRRALTAATAGGLAALGVALGTVGAYLGLAAGFLGDLADLSPPPVLELAVVVFGVPLLAAAGGWLLAGRRSPALSRRAAE
jgi:putative ABC transport system permease protein